MIRHIVLWKLKDVPERSVQESALMIKEKLEALKGIVPEICEMTVSLNVLNPEKNADVMLSALFRSPEDLEAYQKNPDHPEAGKFIKSVTESRSAIDIEC
ncbi:Dabb family protein [Methanosarcinaceae archaeon]|nr:Dabb family protein [Methanosarcinaceae archaeon]